MISKGPVRGGMPWRIGDDHGVRCARTGERFKDRENMTALP
jgi:hypothetical protein